MTSKFRNRGGLLYCVAIAAVTGVLLRLAMPGVFTYLDDERWTFEHVQTALSGGPWPVLGMASSAGIRNPGMSFWVFVFLASFARVSNPEELTRAVAVLAIAAHLAMLFLARRVVRTAEERTIWTWAFVLAMANPIVVFLERKIWAQSVLPVFEIGFLVAWLNRNSRVGAYFWGALGAIVGQIHMAGFFFTPALALFTWLEQPKSVRWKAWWLGTATGALPLIPWVLYVIHDRPHGPHAPWWLRFRLEFYQYFFSDPSSLSISYIVGDDAFAVLSYPRIAGHSTYAVAVACAALAIASVAIAVRVLERAWRLRTKPREWAFGERTETDIVLAAALLGMGVLMTLPSISIYRHYMLAVFPLPYVWTARAALRRPGGQRWLATVFFGSLIVSAGLLSFLVDKDGAQSFGKSWAAQVRDGTSTADAKRFRGGSP